MEKDIAGSCAREAIGNREDGFHTPWLVSWSPIFPLCFRLLPIMGYWGHFPYKGPFPPVVRIE